MIFLKNWRSLGELNPSFQVENLASLPIDEGSVGPGYSADRGRKQGISVIPRRFLDDYALLALRPRHRHRRVLNDQLGFCGALPMIGAQISGHVDRHTPSR